MSSTGYMYYLDNGRTIRVGTYTRITRGGSGADLDVVSSKQLAAVDNKIGDLDDLETEDKSSVVAAVNEVAGYGS